MPAIDDFSSYAYGTSSPANKAEAVTPSDGVDLVYATRAIYVGGAGNVAVVTTGGSTVTFVGAQAGAILPICVSRILATGTTATSLVGLR